MEIIVKKDILDEIQSKGFCQSKEDAEELLSQLLSKIKENIKAGKKVFIKDFGYFQLENLKEDTEITIEDIVNDIKENVFLEEERLRKSIFTIFHFIKEIIIRNNEVQIFDFASFRLDEKPVQVLKNKSGKKVVVPAKKIFVFQPEKKFIQELKGKVKFEADKNFKEQIKQLKSSSILQVVPSKDFFVKTIEFYFEKEGWKVNTTQSIEEAERYINNGDTHLVILDTLVENYNLFCESIKCRKERSKTPLILLYPKGTDLKKSKEFRICGDEQLIQPFELKQLTILIQTLLRRVAEEESIFKQEVMIQFPTKEQNIDKAIELCTKLFKMSGLEEESQLQLSAAFRESLANAAQHGNKHRRDRMIEVLYLLDKEKIITAVTDSGHGFDWQNYIATGQESDPLIRARQSHREGKLGGLGIMLMLRCVDKLEYNDTGNVVTLTKYLKNK